MFKFVEYVLFSKQIDVHPIVIISVSFKVKSKISLISNMYNTFYQVSNLIDFYYTTCITL